MVGWGTQSRLEDKRDEEFLGSTSLPNLVEMGTYQVGISFVDLAMYVLPAALSIREIGAIFFRGPYFIQLFVGLCLVGGTISPIYYWQVRYVRPVLFIFFGVGTVLFIKHIPWRKLRDLSVQSILLMTIRLKAPLLIYILTFVFFFHLYSRFYVFTNHDVLYFGWMQEAWRPGYSGPIRVPTEYPALMASNHLLPGALLSILGLLLPSMNLVKAIDLRYLVICFVMAGLFIEIYRRQSRRFFTILIVGVTLLLAYGAEISTELNMSSFVYVLLLGCIMLVLFEPDSDGKSQRLILMFALLLLAKAPIFLISALVLAYLVIKNLRRSFTFKNIIIFVITLVNIMAWILVPKPVGLGSGFPLPPGFDMTNGIRFSWSSISYHEILSWYVGHEAWFINRYIHPPYIYGIVIFLIVVKIYAIYFYLRKKIGLSPSSVLVLDIYMLISMLSGLFLRNDGSLRQQAHAYLLAATITFIVFVCFVSTRLKLKWKYLVPISLVSILIQIPTRYLPFFENDIDVNRGGTLTLILSQAVEGRISESSLIGKREVYYSILGKRLSLSSDTDYASSQVHLFIQGGR